MRASRIALSFLLCVAVWLSGLFWFVAQIPAEPSHDTRATDAIVVLTGGSGRLEYGLKLLAESKGRKLFISGVSPNVTVAMLLHHAQANSKTPLAPVPARSIVLGHQAENTIGNAEETVRWLREEHYHSIRLVTANYHMPRSIEEFRDVAGDVTIIPDPVFPGDFTLSGWWGDEDSRLLLMMEYHKYLAARLRHWFLSLVRHPQ